MNQYDTIPATEKITLTADCVLCGATKTFVGKRRTWVRWREHLISSDKAFARLSDSDRHWLLSGLCPDELPSEAA